MGSATASPEASPTRGPDKMRPGNEIYVPKQRRSLTGEEQYSVEDADAPVNDKLDSQDSGVVRKGRGTFRGPTNDSQQDPGSPGSRTPRGRDFDATALRQYPPKSGEKSQRVSGKKKSKSGRRQNSNGGLAGSDSGESGSDSNTNNDDVNKLTTSLENISIGKNEKESKPTVQQYSETASPVSQDQTPQTEEEWERLTDEAKLKGLISGQPDGQKQPQQADGQKVENGPRQYKKGHKKSKSKNEYNFDPDAYEGSTRILDVFDFPASFKTHHLHEIFQEYENMRGGYRIKWMEDTRALIIFEHPATARKAYLDHVNNQMAQIKPYDGPTDFLQKNAAATQPRTRPATTDVVARRLVHGALGVRVQRSPEQRQAERQMFQNAKEQLDQKRSDATRRAQDLDTAFNE